MIKINFLQKQSLKKKNERIRFFVIVGYIGLWIFSFYMIAHSYKVNRFIKKVYEAEAKQIENEINKIKPKIDSLKHFSEAVEKIQSEIQMIERNLDYPIELAELLIILTDIIPDKIWLEEVSIVPSSQKDINGKKIIIKGAYYLESNRADLKYVNEFKSGIQGKKELSYFIQDLKVNNSEITHVYKKQTVSFQLSGVWRPLNNHRNF